MERVNITHIPTIPPRVFSYLGLRLWVLRTLLCIAIRINYGSIPSYQPNQTVDSMPASYHVICLGCYMYIFFLFDIYLLFVYWFISTSQWSAEIFFHALYVHVMCSHVFVIVFFTALQSSPEEMHEPWVLAVGMICSDNWGLLGSTLACKQTDKRVRM